MTETENCDSNVIPEPQKPPKKPTLTTTPTTTEDDTVEVEDITYGIVISPHTGRVWLDRNLGASMVCKTPYEPSCYGDYYQWGRNTDGHEKSNSSTTSNQATDINSAGDKFITSSHDSGTDWTNSDNGGNSRNINWTKTDGTSVCPPGFRVPTISELKAETIDVGVNGKSNAFKSFLKFPYSGQRTSKGSMSNQGNQIKSLSIK